MQAAAAAATVEPTSTPAAETPATTAPSGKLDYSKMSQEEKEGRALADMLGMTYEELIAEAAKNKGTGYQGTVSRETGKGGPAPGAHW